MIELTMEELKTIKEWHRKQIIYLDGIIEKTEANNGFDRQTEATASGKNVSHRTWQIKEGV